MDLKAEAFVERLLAKEAEEQPSDNVKPSELVMELPDWFDEEKFNRGRRFYTENSFSLSTSMLMGLVAVFSVPSILRILIGSRRSTSTYTAYKRYLSTLLHTFTWFENELKPGSVSWRSLYTVRSRHLRAGLAAKAKGMGVVSQRDIALTQFGFMGFCMLRADHFSVRQNRDGDWEAYNYFWRVIGHMIGLEDRYNICRETVDETRDVCQILLNRVFTPCLENVPEYFEHMSRSMLEGLWCVNPTIDIEAALYSCRYLASVPGYIYTEADRITLQKKLKEALKGKSLDEGVDTSLLMEKPAIEGLPSRSPRKLYYHDFDTIETVPAYSRMCLRSKLKLFMLNLYLALYSCWIGRWYFNLNFQFSIFLMRNLPFLAFPMFGIKASFVDIFTEDPIDDSVPKPNSEYTKDKKPLSKFRDFLTLLW